LEARRLLSSDTLSTATPVLPPQPYVPDTLTDTIASTTDVRIYAVDLAPLDGLEVDLNAQGQGSSLTGVLRVFDGNGKQLEVREGGDGTDPTVLFATPAAGRFYIGVSGFDNIAYDPNVSHSGTGTSTGPYSIRFTRTPDRSDNNDTLATAEPVSYDPGVSTSESGLEFPTKSGHGVNGYSVRSYSAGETYPSEE
jgi:hypothetical protein